MKKIIVIIGLLISQAGIAQHRGHESMQNRFKHLDSTLGLNEEQKVSIKQILDVQENRMTELKTRDSMLKEEMRSLRKETRESIKAELTPEQQKKLSHILKEHHKGKKMGDRRGVHGHGGRMGLHQKRVAFDSLLTADEKEVISNAQSSLKALKQSVEGKDSLTAEEKKELKLKKENIMKTLDPIRLKYSDQLSDLGDRHRAGKHPAKRPDQADLAIKKQRMQNRFLLMKI